jgi:cephalosporin hydroxylase
VRRNFELYDLLDKRVRFLPGWFSETLPGLSDETWAVLRLDGDMYSSTMQALEALYGNLSPGGFVIIDDYGAIPNCAQAVEDFRLAHGIQDPLQKVDWTGVYWRKGEPPKRRSGSLDEPAREFTKVYWDRRHSTWANTYWRGIPVQKLALDLWVLQEIIQSTRPDVVLETGSKFGGSAAYLADLLQLAGGGRVISVDCSLDVVHDAVRDDDRIEFVEGDSVDAAIVAQVRAELDAYAGLVAEGCYLVVEDTIVNGNPILPDFGPGPGEAVASWIETHPEFEIDRSREHLMATFHPGGYLRRL